MNRTPDTSENGQQLLTIEEKRAWLARIFRDTSGTYTDADKLKALEADNRLVAMQANCQEKLDGLISQKCKIKPHKRNKKYRNDHQSTES